MHLLLLRRAHGLDCGGEGLDLLLQVCVRAFEETKLTTESQIVFRPSEMFFLRFSKFLSQFLDLNHGITLYLKLLIEHLYCIAKSLIIHSHLTVVKNLLRLHRLAKIMAFQLLILKVREQILLQWIYIWRLNRFIYILIDLLIRTSHITIIILFHCIL